MTQSAAGSWQPQLELTLPDLARPALDAEVGGADQGADGVVLPLHSADTRTAWCRVSRKHHRFRFDASFLKPGQRPPTACELHAPSRKPSSAPQAQPQATSAPQAPLPTLESHRQEASGVLRQKAVASVGPIAEMRNGRSRSWQDWQERGYVPAAIALDALDIVVDLTRLDRGAAVDEVIARLTDAVRRSRPTGSAKEARKLAGEILDALLNEAENRDHFTFKYLDAVGAGEVTARTGDFWLLKERHSPEGVDYYVSSAAAINLIVGGLGYDFDDQQAANALLTQRQIDRNEFAAAKNSAEDGRRLTKGYADELRSHIERAKIDVETVDWEGRFNTEMDRAYAHILEQIQFIERMLSAIHEKVSSNTVPAEHLRTAMEVRSTLEECFGWHTQLQREVSGARASLREAQDRQVFVRSSSLRAVALYDEVLRPLMERRPATGERALAAFAAALAGPRILVDGRGDREAELVLGLRTLVDELLAPGRERRAPIGEPVVELVLEEPVPVFTGISEERLGQARAILSGVTDPVRLSSLLDVAASPGDAETADLVLVDLVAIGALMAFTPDGVLPGPHELIPPGLYSHRDGEVLKFTGYEGDDLIVGQGNPDD